MSFKTAKKGVVFGVIFSLGIILVAGVVLKGLGISSENEPLKASGQFILIWVFTPGGILGLPWVIFTSYSEHKRANLERNASGGPGEGH